MQTKAVRVFHGISRTSGSGPLLCSLDDPAIWYCKKSNYTQPPHSDLINEYLLAELFRKSDLLVPEISLVHLDYDAFEEEIKDGFEKAKESITGNYNIQFHYTRDKFQIPLFGSKRFENGPTLLDGKAVEASFELNNFEKPEEVFLIGIADLWFCNKDRKPSSNSNILTTLTKDRKFRLAPIDHCQAFSKTKDYRNLLENNNMLMATESILASGFAQRVVNKTPKKHLDLHCQNAISWCENSLTLVEEVLETIPIEWGIEDEIKQNIVEFLSNEERNELVRSRFNQYLGI